MDMRQALRLKHAYGKLSAVLTAQIAALRRDSAALHHQELELCQAYGRLAASCLVTPKSFARRLDGLRLQKTAKSQSEVALLKRLTHVHGVLLKIDEDLAEMQASDDWAAVETVTDEVSSRLR